MFSTKTNIAQLTALMIEHGIKEVVISPGSRNMPLAETFSNCREFTCHAVTDERSAGFLALGIAQQQASPVAVCVTSGSALLNLASAVSEAYYQQIPLLVISADRPAAWIGQMDGQTLPQMGAFGNLIKHSVSLCEPYDETGKWHNNRMINEALIALSLNQPGPVHINVPITEPFFDCSATELPKERVIRLMEGSEKIIFESWEKAKSPMIIVGQLTPKMARQVAPVLARLGAPILCESLSNLGGDSRNVVFHKLFDLTIISAQNREALTPDLVLYLGGHIISKRLKKWLRALKPQTVWRLSPEGTVADTFQCLTHLIKEQPLPFLTRLESHICSHHHAYNEKWQAYEACTREKITFSDGLSSIKIAYDLCQGIPQGASLVLANSSSVRYAQLASLKEGVDVYCNRGVNGIDGSLSSAVGIAMSDPSRLLFLLIGDLSFFYDMNALWNTTIPKNLRILLINNGCGEIFRTLPGLTDTETAREFVMASHQTTAQGWVESLPCDYMAVHHFSDYQKGLDRMLHHQGSPFVLEVFTDPIQDEKRHKSFYEVFE